jgi:Bacteriophage head to tail connecting protein.
MSAENAARICKRLSDLKGKRQVHEQVWRDCFELTFPLRAHGFNGNVVDAQQAQNQKARIQDSTGTQASQVLASSIMSGLTPANSRWFELDVDGETPDDKRYLDNAAETIWLNIHQSNFDAEGYEACLDTVAAGWFALYVDEDRERGGYSFEQWPIAGVYITSSRRDGLVDTCYREHSMPARTAAETFGLENLSEGTQKLAREKPDELVSFIHAIEPRTPYVVGARMAKNLPFASYVVESKGKQLVRESGYHEFPVIAPRWQRIPDTSYGVGPVFDALPDIRVLNELKALQLASADVAVGGMWVAEDDGVFNPRTAKLGARKILIASSTDAIKPLQTGANFQLADFMVNDLKASIRKILMADQLQPQDGPAMTATEVHVRVEMIRQLLGPIYGRLQAEYLRPLIERCFGIAYRAGILGEPPESLAGRDYSVRYVSPMARAQRLEEVTATQRLYETAGLISQAKGGDMAIFDRLNDDAALEIAADGLGVPSKVMLSDTEMQAKLDARTQAAEQAKQQQMGEQAIAMSAQAQTQQAAAA